jgi:hypothetical protein
MRKLLAAVALALGLTIPLPLPAATAPRCSVHPGQRLVLYGAGDDPDVLAWDSRFRLRDYHAASFDEAEQLLPHAVVEEPGTRAMVESCVAGFVQLPLSESPQDAIGIIILSGPDRGLGKWVLGSDVRLEEARK